MTALSSLLLATQLAHPPMADVDLTVRTTMKELGIPGAAVAVIQSSKPVLVKGYGWSDVAKHTPVEPNTQFQIASLTKPFTAIGVLRLVEQGKIGLRDAASKYLPWLPAQYRQITIEQLLTHTSGIAADMRTSNGDDFSLSDFRDRISASKPAFEPGARWQYANSGYILLSMILEEVSKKPLATYLENEVFRPAGMWDTTLAVPGGKLPFTGYESADKPAPYFSGGFGAGAGVSTINDLVAWSGSMARGGLLRPETAKLALTPANDNAGKPITFDFRDAPTGYGYGWFLTSFKGHRLQTHGGVLSGFSSTVDRYPDDDLTIIVLCNAKAGADRIGYAEVICRRVADKLLAASSSPSDELRRIVQNWDNALVRGDVAAIDAILDDAFVYVTADGKSLSKAALLEQLRKSPKLGSSTSRISLIQVVGDTAVIIAEGSAEWPENGKPTKHDYRFTDVFQRQGSTWKAILTQLGR